jgi:hypothetical protein
MLCSVAGTTTMDREWGIICTFILHSVGLEKYFALLFILYLDSRQKDVLT